MCEMAKEIFIGVIVLEQFLHKIITSTTLLHGKREYEGPLKILNGKTGI